MSSHTERDLPSSIGPTDVSPLTRVDTRSLSDRTFSEPARVPNRAATHIGGADLVGRDDDETMPAVVGRVTASEDQAVFGMADTVSKDGPSDSSEDLAPDPDPVADATMAKILSSHSTTRLGKKSSSRENAAAVREDPDAANAGVKPGCHPDRGFGIDPEVGGAVLGSRINQPGYKTTNQKDTQTSPGAKTNANSLESTPPGGGGFSRRLQRFATLGRAFFPSSTPPSDDDGKPPIRLRRTSSYYGFANDRRHDWSPKKETNFTNPCGAFTNKKHDATECGEDDFLRERRVLARRRDELATFRGRVAGSGKLIASALAGLLAGVVLWAMTTVTAQLTALKFDYTKTLLTLRVEEPGVNAANGGSDGGSEAHNLFTAWAFYAGCAALAIGVTAAYVLHPHGAPMSRGSGIPELKGYLNGNRQQGLFHWRTFLGRSVGICLVITATMPFGREGPSVHIGACAASAVLNLVPWRSRLGWQPSPEERRQILQLGSAAGVAAAFNAPIGGLLYVMEEVASSLPHDYVWRAMLAAGTAVGSAQILYTVNEGRVDYSSLVITDPDSSTGWSPSDLPLIILLAIIAGAFSALFTLVADFFGGLRRKGAEEEENDNDESMNGRKEPTFLKKLKRRVKNMYHSRLGAWCDAVVGAVLVATAQVALPTLFPCRPAPEMVSGTAYNGRRLLGGDFGDDAGRAGLGTYSPARFGDESHEERNSGFLAGHGRSLLSSAVYIPRTFVQYTCRDGDFNEMATLMLQNEEGVVKHLFARDDMYSEELFAPTTVLAFLCYFFVAASVTFGGAFPAGVFIPNMLMGAATGRLFGSLAEMINSSAAPKGTYALIGSAAMLSGFTRMTAAVVVIIIEATASLDVLAPIILACVISRATAAYLIGASLDERLIIAKGVPFLEQDAHPHTAAFKIGDALLDAEKSRGSVIAFRPRENLRVLLNALLLTDHNAFPVLEDVQKSEKMVGLVTRAMLQRVLRVVLEETDDETDDEGKHRDARTSEVRVEIDSGLGSSDDALGGHAKVGSSFSSKSGKSVASLGSMSDKKEKPFHSRASSSPAIDEWSVENFRKSDTSSPRFSGTSSRDLTTDAHAVLSDDDEHGASDLRAQKEGGEFLSVVARWFNAGDKKHTAGRTCGVGKKSLYALNRKSVSVSAKMTAAVMEADSVPTHARAGDENHFDELKEGLVREIRQGLKHVREPQLRRMVDLTHAVDKAPWCVDANTRLGRVHALFARLGVRHLCVTADGGGRLEGIITRHDLIRVHREAEGHGKRD